MKEFWDNYVEQTFDGNRMADFKLKQFEANYRKYFPEDRNVPLLDIGVGRGEMLLSMKNWGYTNYQGVDISSSTTSFCQSQGLLCHLVDDVPSWLNKTGSRFGLITLLDVLEHIEKNEVIRFLKQLYQTLLPGGVLLIQVPNAQSPDSNLYLYGDFTHQTTFTEYSLKQVLVTSGFRDVSFCGFEDALSKGFRRIVRTSLRSFFWSWARATRRINGNLNPQILHPIFFAVVKK